MEMYRNFIKVFLNLSELFFIGGKLYFIFMIFFIYKTLFDLQQVFLLRFILLNVITL